jgi:hypothetical protein
MPCSLTVSCVEAFVGTETRSYSRKLERSGNKPRPAKAGFREEHFRRTTHEGDPSAILPDHLRMAMLGVRRAETLVEVREDDGPSLFVACAGFLVQKACVGQAKKRACGLRFEFDLDHCFGAACAW